jgi:trigger factor
MQIKINKLPESLIEIEGQIEWADFEENRPEATKHLGQHIELPGFRKGHVPENILLKNIPESRILEEMAEIAMPKIFLKIIEENKIDAIGRPEIAITKLAPNNPMGFKIKTSVLPEVKLPDYKAIARENKNKDIKVEVNQEEMEKTIEQIKKMRTPKDAAEPELNDEFVKTLGNFKDVEDFKNKLKDNIKLEKEAKEKEKQRIKIIEAILDKTPIEVPGILIESELDKMIYQMKADIENSGLVFEDYLKHLNKTEDDMRKDFRKDAEKRSKLELVLRALGIAEDIKVPEEDIKAEVEQVLKLYKDADKARARAYVENILTNEKIWQFLENQ